MTTHSILASSRIGKMCDVPRKRLGRTQKLTLGSLIPVRLVWGLSKTRKAAKLAVYEATMIIAKPAHTIPRTRAEKLRGVPEKYIFGNHKYKIAYLWVKYDVVENLLQFPNLPSFFNSNVPHIDDWPSPMPELSRTPQANQIALVRLSDSSFWCAAAVGDDDWNLPNGENRSKR